MPIRVKGPTADRHPRREWNSPERRRERQKKYMDKHGERTPRRKRLATTDKYKDVREQRKFSEAGFKPLRAAKATGGAAGRKAATHKGKPTQTIRDLLKQTRPKNWRDFSRRLGGGEKGKPHSSKEGQKAAGRRRFKRIVQRAPDPKRKPGTPAPINPPKSPYIKDRVMTPLRAKKAVGGAAKITKRFLDFIKTGKHVDKDGVKVNVPKAAERLTGKPHVDHGKRKKIKHLGKGKAEGGRANFRHGGSVGAAIKGHGAEIK